MVANILPAEPRPDVGMGSIGQNSTFSEHGHIAYQIKGNHQCSNMVANILPSPPPLPPPHPRPWDGINMSKFNFSAHGYVAYQIKGNHEMQHYDSKHFPTDPLPPIPDPWKGSTGQND